LLLLPFAGCHPSGPTAFVPLKPVVVNEAAAYPSQEPGTKPPILTGFATLTKEQLDEGWVQLFDGVSTYGWEVTEGEGTITVMTDGTKNYLVLDKQDKEKTIILHRGSEITLEYKSDGKHPDFSTIHFETFLDAQAPRYTSMNELRGVLCPMEIQPLTESDWKPAAGKSEAKWSDGILELTGGLGMVETVKEYGDFILQLEYFTEKGVNSGVFFRCIQGEMMNGYEVQIFNSPPDEDYKKFIGTDTGGIFRRQVGRNVGPKDGEWNYLTIAVRGADVATWVNGIQVTDWTDTQEEHENPRNGLRLQPGTIQLQGHDADTKILFRNFRIVEIKQKL